MIPKRYKWPRSAQEPAPLVPPKLEDLGCVDFSVDDRRVLAAWLSEEGWPRSRMDIATLEGYLVAMILWPVSTSPGAWLPAIWGISGWKVAEKISTPDLFQKFNRLVVGYRQQLALVLTVDPSGFLPVLGGAPHLAGDAHGSTRWSAGFLLALQQGSQGFNWRSPEVTAAVNLIAGHAEAKPHRAESQGQIAVLLGAAVRTIVADSAIGRPVASVKHRPHFQLH